jgi:3-hydroxyacyl-CoA dehydrogenase
MRTMIEDGYRIEEVDQITGPAMGRPKMGTFKLGDLVGLDIMAHVSRNLYERLPAGKERDTFAPSPFMEQMIKNQWLGLKTKQGFYKKVKGDGKEETLVLDYTKLEYRPQQKVNLPSLEMAKNIEDVRERVKAFVMNPDRGGRNLRPGPGADAVGGGGVGVGIHCKCHQ